jgi:2-succinyl-5-enolpyruvyl-6-hydroxy-3-cyclohexene-1-carboxylate synthase
MTTGFANTNALHAAVAARTLTNLGARAVVISPGSRSTPLTHAFVSVPELDCTPVLDERTAGFFALGRAKASGLPAVLLCTSGTAAANYLPAVIEARMSGTPLIVLTADRPHEMRDCASGQTIDQVKIFGHYPVWQAELACPDSGCGTLAHWRQSFAHAFERAVEARGPVHLNLPFRDPLAPHEAQPGFITPAGFDLEKFCAHKKPLQVAPGDNTIVDIAFWTKYNVPKETHHRGIIVVGSGPGDERRAEAFAKGVFTLAKFIGYPVLTDALNPLRGNPGADESIVTGYDLILRDDTLAETLKPAVVIRIGQPPTSKVLRRRLEEWDAPTLVVSPTGENLDPLHRRSSTLRGSPENWASDGFARKQSEHNYAEQWADLDASVGLDLDTALDAEPALREPHVTALLAKHLPENTPLFVANSMPVRDTETFLPRGARAHPVFHNRGANGIDGTLGTALGVAAGLGRHTALLTGDLSLLHDTNALLLASRLRTTLTVILVNNAGGGIFNHLAVAKHPAFEEFWATPQTVDFQKLAAAYTGVTYTLVEDKTALAASLAETPDVPGIRILEIRTERAGDAAWRKSLYARIGG